MRELRCRLQYLHSGGRLAGSHRHGDPDYGLRQRSLRRRDEAQGGFDHTTNRQSAMSTHLTLSRGFSLIELMIAMTIGLLILAGLVTLFVNTSQSQQALQRSAQQIENGRYAMDVLIQDLHHAGYYGRYSAYSDGTTLPDPCITGNPTAILGT